MAKLTREQIAEIRSYLDSGQPLPTDYKYILFPPEKAECELLYVGKDRAEDVLADTWSIPLQPIRTFNLPKGSPQPKWENRLIFGDNLQVMKRLLEDPQVCGQVKLIYIDPPFATKQDFLGSQEQKAYQDKIAGADFIEFLRKRLIVLKRLLHRDGSIFVHLDQRKVHYIKVVLDEVLGEENFRNEINSPGQGVEESSAAIRLNKSSQCPARYLALVQRKSEDSFWAIVDRKAQRWKPGRALASLLEHC